MKEKENLDKRWRWSFSHSKCFLIRTGYKPGKKKRPIKSKPKETILNTVRANVKSCADHRTRAHLDSISIVQIIINDLLRERRISWRPLSTLYAEIRVTQRHPQDTLLFYHILQLTTSFRYWLERLSANVPAVTFVIHREDSPLRFIDCHRTDHFFILIFHLFYFNFSFISYLIMIWS